jgi:hypothetical protein
MIQIIITVKQKNFIKNNNYAYKNSYNNNIIVVIDINKDVGKTDFNFNLNMKEIKKIIN